ncbi:hypothetical protein D3C73_1392050 [compost metagenome]
MFFNSISVNVLQIVRQIVTHIAAYRNGLGIQNFAYKRRVDIELNQGSRMVLRFQIADGHVTQA